MLLILATLTLFTAGTLLGCRTGHEVLVDLGQALAGFARWRLFLSLDEALHLESPLILRSRLGHI